MIRALAPVAALLLSVALLLAGNGLQNTLAPVRASLEGFRRLHSAAWVPPIILVSDWAAFLDRRSSGTPGIFGHSLPWWRSLRQRR